MLTRPARDVSPKEVINAIETGMKKTGYSDFSLLSLSCSDYLALPAVGIELRNRLSKENISLQLHFRALSPPRRGDSFCREEFKRDEASRSGGLWYCSNLSEPGFV